MDAPTELSFWVRGCVVTVATKNLEGSPIQSCAQHNLHRTCMQWGQGYCWPYWRFGFQNPCCTQFLCDCLVWALILEAKRLLAAIPRLVLSRCVPPLLAASFPVSNLPFSYRSLQHLQGRESFLSPTPKFARTDFPSGFLTYGSCKKLSEKEGGWVPEPALFPDSAQWWAHPALAGWENERDNGESMALFLAAGFSKEGPVGSIPSTKRISRVLR